MIRVLIFVLALLPCAAEAIVIRADVGDANYRVAPSVYPPLADLPGEGHGVLIAPRWILTAAHAVSWQMSVDTVNLGGVPRAVKRLVIYPGWHRLPQTLIDRTLATGETADVKNFLEAQNDVALVELAQPVRDITPATMDDGDVALGTVAELIGKGATGTGVTGEISGGSHRTELRHAFTRITTVEDRWLCYTFQAPPSALPLEGMSGSGDSGGPVLVQVNGQREVAGLVSWKLVQGDARTFHAGIYGSVTCSVRVAHYAQWINGIVNGADQ